MQIAISKDKKHILAIGLLVFIAAGVFVNTLSNAFIWDDETLILKDRHIREIGNIPFFFTPEYWNVFFKGTKGQYRPVRTVTFALDYAFWGESPAGYHLTNIILHVFNTLLVYILACMILKKEQNQGQGKQCSYINTAFLSAVFFALHPIHAESVAWVKNRSDLLCALFLWGSFLFFIVYAEKKNILFYVLSAGSFIISLGAKEMALALPLILIVYLAVWENRLDKRQKLIRTIPFLAISAIYLIFKALSLGAVISGSNDQILGVYQSLLSVIKTLGYYLMLLVYPFSLNAERLFVIPAGILDLWVLCSAAVLAMYGLFMFKAWKRDKTIVFFLAFILVSLLPASNIVFISGRPIAEQRLYIASAGFCVLLALGLRRLFVKKKILALILSVFLCAGYAYTTVMRNSDWKNSVIFWTKTVEQSPQSSRAYNNLGKSYALAREPEKAVISLEQAVILDRENADAYYNLGLLFHNQGQIEKALANLIKSAELNPYRADVHNNLGLIYEYLGRYIEAEEEYTQAVRHDPYFAAAYDNLGALYVSSGRIEQSLSLFNKALEIDPVYAKAWHNLGVAYFKKNDLDKAFDAFSQAIAIDNYYVKAYNNLGLVSLHQKDYVRAEKNFTKALLLEPENVRTYSNLGAVYSASGKSREAAAAYRSLLAIDPDNAKAAYNLAIVYKNSNENDQSLFWAQKALELGYEESKDLIEQIGKEQVNKQLK